MLKKIVIISSLLILVSCSGPNSKNLYSHEDVLRSTAKITKERLHKLNFEKEISKQDLHALAELGKEFTATSVRKVSILPIAKNKDSLLISINAAKKAKDTLIESGLSENIIEIGKIDIDEKSTDNYMLMKSYLYDVVLPTADKWKYDIGDIDITKETPNFGVATSYNLGLMIANPRDLIDPAEMSETDAKSAVKNVRKVLGGTTAGGTAAGGTASGGGASGGAAGGGAVASK